MNAVLDAGAEVKRVRSEQRKRAQAIGDGVEVPMPELMTLQEMRERLVFISDGSRVALRGSPHTVLPFGEFRKHAGASKTPQGKRLVLTADVWVEDDARITVHTVTFRPGGAEFDINPDGVKSLNLWVPRVRPASDADVAPFLEHINYLVPDVCERAPFLDWLAHLEQRPEELPHTHYLMITPQTGIGRNWLASLLARVFPGECRLGFDLAGMLNSGFNGPLSRRTLVIVDELKAADSGYSAANHAQQLKAMLTTEVRTINPKFGRVHHEHNVARFLMFSQHDDALPLEKYDRRVIVIDNPTQRRSPTYYADLYAKLDDADFVAGVAQYLARRDISGFNPSKPAPLTETKQRAIRATMSDVEQVLAALRDGTSRSVMKAGEITEFLIDHGVARPNGRAMSSAYRAVGFVTCERLASVHGKQHRVVALRDVELYRGMSSADLARCLNSEC
jgi:uncharacterized protein DUF5906